MPSSGLFWACHQQTNGASVRVSGWFAIDGLTHHEHPTVVRVAQAALGILLPGLIAHRLEHGVVELLRPFDVVAGDHNVTEHFGSSNVLEAFASASGIDHGQSSGEGARS